jgi:hypothetical protein
MDAKALETRLLENPKYGSTWIELAVKILTGSNMLSEAKLAEFDAEQLDIINAAIEYNKKNEDKPIDITVLCDSKLNATQMRLILLVNRMVFLMKRLRLLSMQRLRMLHLIMFFRLLLMVMI